VRQSYGQRSRSWCAKAEESLGAGGTGIIKGSDRSKLSNEKHEKTVIDLGKGGFGLGDELELLGLDLVPSIM
jgi:hypothetical protein